MEQSDRDDDDEDEEDNDDSTDDGDSSSGHETEQDADDEGDGCGADEDFFGHSLELHEDFVRAADPRMRKQKQQEYERLVHHSHSHHTLTLGDDPEEGNELLWSSATTSDPQTTRDSMFSFFPLEEKDVMEEDAQKTEEAGLLDWLTHGDEENNRANEDEQGRSRKREEASFGSFLFADEPLLMQRTTTKAVFFPSTGHHHHLTGGHTLYRRRRHDVPFLFRIYILITKVYHTIVLSSVFFDTYNYDIIDGR